VVCAGSFAVMSQFHAVYQWYIAGAVMGFAASFVLLAPAPIMITNWFAAKKGLAMGLAMACSGLGGAIMGPIGASFITNFGWRNAYLLMALISAIVVLPFTIFVVRFSPARVGLEPYGAEAAAPAPAKTDATDKAEAAKKTVLPVVTARVALSSPAFWLLFLSMGLVASATTYAQHLPGFAQSIGLSAGVGASLLSALMIGNIIGKLTLGVLNDRIGARNAMCAGLVIVFLAFVGLCFNISAVPVLLVLCGVIGFSLSMTAVSNPLVCAEVFGPRDYSQVFAYVSMAVSLVSAFFVTVVGYIYDATGAYTMAFVVGAGLCVGSIITLVAAVAAKKALWARQARIDQAAAAA
jgi:MFS family permease